MNRLSFPGVRKPLSNFEAVKTDLQTQLLVYEVDLSSSRSLAANTAEELRFAGNALYIDKASDVGNATIIFQDDSRLKPARVYVEPGFIARVPWTRVLIENTAQPGKVLRIFYGVDIDFVPGTSADVNISGVVNVDLQPFVYGASFRSGALLAALTPENVFTVSANTNGAILWSASFQSASNANLPRAAFLSRTSVPTSMTNGDVLVSTDSIGIITNFYSANGKLPRPVYIPAGMGLWFICDQLEVVAFRHALYTLL